MEKNEELRFFTVSELRAGKGDDGKTTITGYAAMFDSLSEDLGGFVERIKPGAFAGSLAGGDQRALWNHNSDYVLGRRKSGSLELAEDENGLRFVIYPPDTQWAKDALESMRRGDVDSMSFGFRTKKDAWEQAGDQVIRTLIDVDLFEVSPVAFPAYPQTSAYVRSMYERFIAKTGVNQPDPDGQVDDQGREDGQAQARRARRQRRLELLHKK